VSLNTKLIPKALIMCWLRISGSALEPNSLSEYNTTLIDVVITHSCRPVTCNVSTGHLTPTLLPFRYLLTCPHFITRLVKVNVNGSWERGTRAITAERST